MLGRLHRVSASVLVLSSRVTVSSSSVGFMTGMNGYVADSLWSRSRHLTFSGHSGPSSRTSSPPSTLISSGECRGQVGAVGSGGKEELEPRVWGQRLAQREHPKSLPLLS